MMSRLVLNSFNSVRLFHTASSRRASRVPQIRKSSIKQARVASKHYSLPQIQKSHEANPRNLDHDPSRRFEPFPYAITEENKLDTVRRVLTPLYNVPYGEQLAAKESLCRNALRTLAQDLYRSGTPVRMDVMRLPCQVNKIVAAPQLHNYRNTDELSVWYGNDGKTLTVGYYVFPISKHGDTVAVEPNGCDVLRRETIKLCDILQEFMRSQTKLGASLSLGTQGGWRRFRIATNSSGDLMLVGFLNPRTLKVREVIDDRDLFRDFIVERCKSEGLNLVSLYYQASPDSISRNEYELLYGEKRLTETIGQRKFLISPDSYCHHSSIGAGLLFETVRKTIKDCFLKQDNSDEPSVLKPLILDAKCGFGLLSLQLADLAERMIGVDDRALAVDDARENAELNGVHNCDFINANLEIILERIIDKYCAKGRKELLVVCDMPPGGLHNNIVQVIRQCSLIKKVILISSRLNGQKSIATITNLCQKGQARSLPQFAPILATPVDVCPLTEAFHTVLAFERTP